MAATPPTSPTSHGFNVFPASAATPSAGEGSTIEALASSVSTKTPR